MKKLVIPTGLGTDAAGRRLAAPTENTVLVTSIVPFKRRAEGPCCARAKNPYRQRPLRFMEAIDRIVASVAGGVYPDVRTAARHISAKVGPSFKPLKESLEAYNNLYLKYRNLTYAKSRI